MTNRRYDFTLAAAVGASQRIDVGGSYVKVLAAGGGSVGVKLDGGQEIELQAGQGFRMLPRADGSIPQFRDVTVRNLQAVANVGSIFIGSAGFEDSRITGTVSVADQSSDKSLAGNQFWGSLGQAASAGQCAIATLQANGKTVVIKGISVQSTTAGIIVVAFGSNIGTSAPAPAAFNGNKVQGGAASSARVAAGYAAGTTPTGAEVPGYQLLAVPTVPANTLVNVPLTTPLILRGTACLVINAFALNRDINSVLDFEEI